MSLKREREKRETSQIQRTINGSFLSPFHISFLSFLSLSLPLSLSLSLSSLSSLFPLLLSFSLPGVQRRVCAPMNVLSCDQIDTALETERSEGRGDVKLIGCVGFENVTREERR
jgi:hypothetical protein